MRYINKALLFYITSSTLISLKFRSAAAAHEQIPD